jgi:hypothetical protein
MGDYIALHGLVPENEMPEHLRYKIPKDEIWMRTDVYNNKDVGNISFRVMRNLNLA